MLQGAQFLLCLWAVWLVQILPPIFVGLRLWIMKRLKVAIVSDTFLPQVGGLEVHMHDLAEELTRRGHEAHVICAEPRDTVSTVFPVHRLPVKRLPFVHRIGQPESFRVLQRHLQEGRYDIVHGTAFFFRRWRTLLRTLPASWGIPSVFTLHSVLLGPAGVLLRMANRRFGWASWPTILTGVSQFVTRELSAVSGRDDVQVLLNAVRMESWSTEQPRSGKRVVSVLRMTPRKRPLDVIRMVPNVLAQLPRHAWPKFTLIGDGPLRSDVEKEIRKLGIADHVELTGLLSRDAIRNMLYRSSVFALPSYLEALPIAVIEARAAGLPVVARTPQRRLRIIEHGRHGLWLMTPMSLSGTWFHCSGMMRYGPGCLPKHARNWAVFPGKASIDRHEKLYAQARKSAGVAGRRLVHSAT